MWTGTDLLQAITYTLKITLQWNKPFFIDIGKIVWKVGIHKDAFAGITCIVSVQLWSGGLEADLDNAESQLLGGPDNRGSAINFYVGTLSVKPQRQLSILSKIIVNAWFASVSGQVFQNERLSPSFLSKSLSNKTPFATITHQFLFDKTKQPEQWRQQYSLIYDSHFLTNSHGCLVFSAIKLYRKQNKVRQKLWSTAFWSEMFLSML